MRENGIAVFVEADGKTGAIRMEKLGDLENWDLFQQLVLYSDADTLCDSSGRRFPYQVWGQGGTGCLLSWLSDGRAAALFFDSQLSGKAQIDWVQALDKKVRSLYETAG